MKTAICYDYINQYGGGERVLQIFLDIFKSADFYTLFYDPSTNLIDKNRLVKTSFLDNYIVHKNHRAFIPFMPSAANSINLKNKYDLIISITAGYAKGINYNFETTKHISYIFTPLRYAFEDEYIPNKIGYKNKYLKHLINPVKNYLKNWDYKMAQRPNKIITISSLTQDRIKKYYNRDSEILTPGVDTKIFYPNLQKTKSYYLAMGRLMHYKKFDLIIKTFNTLKLPLKIVGRGPELKKLNQLNTSRYTSFLSSPQSDESLRLLYSQAKALIFPQVEDFGLVALESIACNTPVIAYQKSGIIDIIKENINGTLIKEQTEEEIIKALKKLENIDTNNIYKTVEHLSLDNFKTNIQKIFS